MDTTVTASNLTWQTLWLKGLPAKSLDYLHGFLAPPEPIFPVDLPILISAVKDFIVPNETTVCLETEFSRVELCSNAAARLNFKRSISDGSSKDLLPLTAALAQQWLLSGSLSLHAAVFKVNGRTLLVLGNSLAGKSTLVRSAMQIGATVVSDDLVRLTFSSSPSSDFSEHKIIAHSLRGFVRFRQVASLPEQCVFIDSADSRFAPSMAIDGVVFLDSAPRSEATLYSNISVLEATAQLINQSAPLFMRRGFQAERTNMLSFIHRLLQQVPFVRANTGFDVLNSPEFAFQRLFASIWPNP